MDISQRAIDILENAKGKPFTCSMCDSFVDSNDGRNVIIRFKTGIILLICKKCEEEQAAMFDKYNNDSR